MVPYPYDAVVAVEKSGRVRGGFVEDARRQVGATGADGLLVGGVEGPGAGAVAAGAGLDVATSIATGVPFVGAFTQQFAQPTVRLVGIRSIGPSRHETRPILVSGEHRFKSVSAGWWHTCGLTEDGDVLCWGWNSHGQLGDGSRAQRFTPQRIKNYLAFTSLSSSGAHTCALPESGVAYCWGENHLGQLGLGYIVPYSELAVPATGGLAFESLAVGFAHTCGRAAGGGTYCWGYNGEGQLGTGDTVSVSQPVPVAEHLSFSHLAAGYYHTCGLTMSGRAYCWGNNEGGQLGDGSTSQRLNPTAVSGELQFTSLTAGRLHTCGLTPAGAAHCWGVGAVGALGDGSKKSRRDEPVAVESDLSFQSLSAGAYHTCAVTTDGQLYCWGLNQHGQLGSESGLEGCKLLEGYQVSCATIPVPVSTESEFLRVSAGVAHTCAISSDGAAFCWGAGTAGQLGDGGK